MAWTEQQLKTLKVPFSYHTKDHREVVFEKLQEFKQHQALLQRRNKVILAGFVLGYIASLMGPSFLFIHSSNLVYLGLGAFIYSCKEVNQKYNELFKDMQTIYDWCVPNCKSLPPFDNALLQNLIETMGTLINPERIERLATLINGPKEQSSISSYAVSGGQALFSMAKDLVNTEDNQDNTIMDQPTFTLLMRNLVQGKSTSTLDFYLYGEGRFSISEQIMGRLPSLLPFVSKWMSDYMSDSDAANTSNHAHSM